MNPHPSRPTSRTSSTAAPPSSLRPRTRRLISIDDEAHRTAPAQPTRVASPRGSPAPAPSRSQQQPWPWRTASSETLKPLSSLLPSWSSLTTLASNAFRDDPPRRRPRSPPSTWGPVAESHIGTGSRESRQAAVRAAKRKDLLSANGPDGLDEMGRFKRRNSDDEDSSAPPPEDRPALVYLHHVQPGDTLAGLTIRYNCTPAVLRKANRLWPSDPIQSRKVVVLPVEACGVKGRPVPGPGAEEDLLPDVQEESEVPSKAPNGWHDTAPGTPDDDEDKPWTHDSWVLFPNANSPTEIVRLPSRTLGFFPRARRRSNQPSADGTPGASLDLPRPGMRTRSSSTATTSAAAFPPRSLLHGPGGVGTLDRNVCAPGPAPDGLNRILGPHLPSMAPPPGVSAYTMWETGEGSGGEVGPVQDGVGLDIDLNELGGKVETWVRRVARSAGRALEAGQARNGNVNGVAGMGGLNGDLIELVDAFEIGDDERERDGEDEGGGEGSSAVDLRREGVRGRRRHED
ncbi:hypothetical protein EJ06DRAFT_579390 [Trichodelitschia bisporula]|uniref:LysM domain-containing protein n=1 Tax=Trichodelitschia bisporula TaxID=703511 RepID=A0A6G1I5B5_9PEZI|nr:hypothetical protein EJ06DRAFT_579390 [Trichodelitschia bisporula]